MGAAPNARLTFAVAVGAVGAVVLASAGCGPSFQAVYEGNARFEHCYALEENPQRHLPEKASCWRDWSERYTYGQTRDRINYATARFVALTEVPNAPTDEAIMMAAPGETPRRSTITAPAPSSAFAPPPKTLDVAPRTGSPAGPGPRPASEIPNLSTDGGVPDRVAIVAMPTLPATTCTDTCGGAFRGCNIGCEAPAAAKTKSCQACVRIYRSCMRECFK